MSSIVLSETDLEGRLKGIEICCFNRTKHQKRYDQDRTEELPIHNSTLVSYTNLRFLRQPLIFRISLKNRRVNQIERRLKIIFEDDFKCLGPMFAQFLH